MCRHAVSLAVLVTLAGSAFAEEEVLETAPDPGSDPTAAAAAERPTPGLTTLADVEVLVRAGTLGLAARRLEQSTAAAPGTPSWLRWEERLLDVYAMQKRWDAVVARIGSRLAPGLAPEAAQALRARLAEAYIESGDGAAARRVLRGLLWGDAPDGARIAAWRRAIVRSYVAEGAVEDARAAMLRFDTEYRPDDVEWRLLYARVLLEAGDPGQAAATIATLQTHAGRVLLLLARLREGSDTPEQVIEQGLALAGDDTLSGVVRRDVWSVIAEAASVAGDLDRRVEALEHVVAGGSAPAPPVRGAAGADELWRAYRELAQETGNRAMLLIGAPQPWVEEAVRLERHRPHAARAVFAFLIATASPSAEESAAHHEALVDSLLDAGLAPVVQALYGPERRFDYTALTPALRVRLSQMAFERGDVRGAAEPVLDLDEPAAGEPQLDWELRRARLQLFTGDFTGGERRLLALLDRVSVLSEQDADRAVQLAFDLQSVDRHESALRVLERLLARTDSPRQHREFLLWMAESREALAHHADAGELFLRSAMVAADGLDGWGRAARFRAAEALRTAGLLDDARLLYEGLLQATSDPRERARIGHALQSLTVARAAREPS